MSERREPLTFRLNSAGRKKLEARAEREGVTVSELIRHLLAWGLDRMPPIPKKKQ